METKRRKKSFTILKNNTLKTLKLQNQLFCMKNFAMAKPCHLNLLLTCNFFFVFARFLSLAMLKKEQYGQLLQVSPNKKNQKSQLPFSKLVNIAKDSCFYCTINRANDKIILKKNSFGSSFETFFYALSSVQDFTGRFLPIYLILCKL